ncbi:MAG TPA: hypothetical protein DEP47_13495, partial [Chloroflexi bacterium]|nr:hypothetical protein [Chloroflexota bacterium]
MSRKLIPAVALLILIIALWPKANSLYDLTGEEEIPGQLRGVVHWLYTAIRPQPDQGSVTNIAFSDVLPFGMNTFLQNEVLPEVREQSMQMLQAAGVKFIRQQFPWEDIEIHGKGDFEDRRQ